MPDASDRRSPPAVPPLPAWRRYLRFWGPNVDADVDDELQFHLDMRAREFEARGLSPAEASRAARERFGDLERIGGALRDHDRARERRESRREYMSDLTQDLRYGWRALLRAPAFTAVAVLTLALGIGATTAVFSVVDAVLLKPLPYPDADRVIMVWMDNRRTHMAEDIHSWPNFADYRAQNAVFAHLAAYSPQGFNLSGACPETECEPLRVTAAMATASLFDVLGVRPALGRPFTADAEQEGRDAVALISHGLWTAQFGADPHVVGKPIRLNGRERTIVGVMPKGFAFPNAQTDVWVPLALQQDAREARSWFSLWVVGRLKPGVPLQRARADMTAIAKRLETQYPDLRDLGVNLVPLPQQVLGKTLPTALMVMLGAVAAVLLIACANVANLMLSRAATREREIGVRLALGAGRMRIVRQLLTESVLLAAVGGALGVALAWLGLRALLALAPADIPRLDQVRIDLVVLGVALAVAVITGILFGLAPAMRASRHNLSEALREGARGSTGGAEGHRVRRLLAGAQVALVVVLLTGSGLLIRSFLRLQQVELGFRPDHLLTMRVALSGAKYRPLPPRVAFFDGLVERVRALPGVRGAGLISTVFLTQTPNSTGFAIEGRASTPDIANTEIPFDAVSPDYFRTMGVELKQGRAFTAADVSDGPPVVIINQNFAKHFWPNESALGKRFKLGGERSDAPWMTIVGVVGDMRRTGFDAPERYEAYLPYAQQTYSQMTLVVRTTNDPLALVPAVRAALRSLDPTIPIYQVQTIEQQLGEMVAQRRFSMALLGTFAALALVLGLVGVYGVTAYLVAQRTREVGLRLALGAHPRDVVRMVVGQGMRSAVVGVAVGLAASLVVTRLMASLLYGVSPTDAVTLLAVTALLALATLVANWLPARRAARVDPLVALRAE